MAVFTNQFPAPVSTFFARNMRGLIEAGVHVEIFPIYPLDDSLWQYVPDVLNEEVLPREYVHHVGLGESLLAFRKGTRQQLAAFGRAAGQIGKEALGHGAEHFAKNLYVLPKAWAWAQRHAGRFDHVLAFWGNYAATCAFLYHMIGGREAAFSMMLRAGLDLYEPSAYMRQKMRYADRLIFSCAFNQRFAEKAYSDLAGPIEEKGTVCYEGLNVEDLFYEPEERPPSKIVAVGSLNPRKGFRYLLDAVHLLDERGMSCEVELVGDGPEASRLKNLADRYELADRVHFRGWVKPQEAQQAMREATLLVHPSRQLGDAEPNVIKEALCIGTPVVASDLAGIPELLDHGRCGTLVPPRNVEALADAIEKVLEDRSLRRRYAEAGREHMEAQFDMRKNGDRLARLLRGTHRRHAISAS